MSNFKNVTKRRAWPEKRRKAQAERAKRQKPWLYTTGPQTDTGKAASAKNAYRHGFRSEDMREIRRLLRVHQAWLKAIMAGHKEQNGGYSSK